MGFNTAFKGLMQIPTGSDSEMSKLHLQNDKIWI